MRQDDAAITCLRPWSSDSFWSSSSTGAVNLWRLAGSSGSIVAQLTGTDCEPVHDLCITPTTAFVAAHNAVRAYTLSSLPIGAADTQDWHGLELPAPRAISSSSSSSSGGAGASSATAAAASI
jgi:hypothetical protein